MKKYIIIILIINHCLLFAQFNPVDINELSFFVETRDIDINNHVAFCNTSSCLNHSNSEGAPIDEQYCDTSNSCSDGCLRRWQDKSSYTPSGGFNPPEYTSGRNFGQDDSEKPCFIPNCINGQPCIRGGGPYGSFNQDKYLEIQISDFINLANEFSIFLLAKPIDQSSTGEWYYFGQSNSFLRHDISNNRLKLRVPGNLVTNVSVNNSIELNKWQLIEIHRDSNNIITTYINGNETSLDNIALPGTFTIGYLFSNFKTTGNFNQTAMYGDIASFLVYDKKTTTNENNDIRNYFDSHYLGNILNINQEVLYKYSIHPIPFKDNFIVNNNSNNPVKNIELYDLIGHKIEIEYLFANNKKIQVNLKGNIKNGIYLLKISTNTGYKTIKIIKY